MRLTNLQALRGVACLLVLGIHTAECELKRCESPAIVVAEPFEHFGFAGVDLFFVLSGFVITWVTYEKLGRRSEFVGFAWRRLWRIYPLYLACWIGVVLVYLFVLRIQFVPTWRWAIGNMMILPAQQSHLFIPQAWSLVYELIFYGVFAVFLLVPRGLFVPTLTAWAILIVLSATSGVPAPIPRGPVGRCATHLLSPLVLEFLIGCGAALLVRSARAAAWSRFALAVGIAGFVLASVIQWLGWMDAKIEFLSRAGTFGVASGFLVFGATAAERRHGWSSPRWLQGVGDASYSIYLSHVCAMEIVCYCWRNQSHAVGPHLVYVTLLIGGSLLLGFAVHFLLERPLMRCVQRRSRLKEAQPELLRRAA